jgi:enterochelin esterase family protein
MTRGVLVLGAGILVAVVQLGSGVGAQAQGTGPRSPDIHPDGRVTLRLAAPQAREVSVRGDWGMTRRVERASLTRDDSGLWSCTIGPSLPIVVRYSFVVDGLVMPDPRNERVLASAGTVQSLLVVPSAAEAFAAVNGVAHGTVRAVTYQSSSLGIPRRVHVYTPPGYDRASDSLPILYLLPGAGGDDVQWSALGRAGEILDNLIAAGRAKPMIAVMPDPRVPGQPNDILPTAPPDDRFSDDFLKDLVPFVERTFRVRAGAGATALAGLSTGGAKALLIGLNNFDKFSQIGLFSSGWFPADLAKVEEKQRRLLDDPALRKRLRLLWIAVGRDDSSAAFPNTPHLLAMLTRHGIPYQYRESDGDHTWINWRRYFNEFAPLLFR